MVSMIWREQVGCTPEGRRVVSMPRDGLRYHPTPNLPLLGVKYMIKKNMPCYHMKNM